MTASVGSTPRALRALIAPLALSAALLLTACGGGVPGGLGGGEEQVEEILGEELGSEVDVETGALPAGFPGGIPITGAVVQGVSVDQNGAPAFSVVTTFPGTVEQAQEEAERALIGAGFERQMEGISAFEGKGYVVLVVAIDDETSGVQIAYTVVAEEQ